MSWRHSSSFSLHDQRGIKAGKTVSEHELQGADLLIGIRLFKPQRIPLLIWRKSSRRACARRDIRKVRSLRLSVPTMEVAPLLWGNAGVRWKESTVSGKRL